MVAVSSSLRKRMEDSSQYSSCVMLPNGNVITTGVSSVNMQSRSLVVVTAEAKPDPSIGKITTRLDSLENEIKETKAMLSILAENMGISFSPTPVRKISKKKAKEEIANYFLKNDGKEIGYEDLEAALQIDLKLVWQICNELEAEGKIA